MLRTYERQWNVTKQWNNLFPGNFSVLNETRTYTGLLRHESRSKNAQTFARAIDVNHRSQNFFRYSSVTTVVVNIFRRFSKTENRLLCRRKPRHNDDAIFASCCRREKHRRKKRSKQLCCRLIRSRIDRSCHK